MISSEFKSHRQVCVERRKPAPGGPQSMPNPIAVPTNSRADAVLGSSPSGERNGGPERSLPHPVPRHRRRVGFGDDGRNRCLRPAPSAGTKGTHGAYATYTRDTLGRSADSVAYAIALAPDAAAGQAVPNGVGCCHGFDIESAFACGGGWIPSEAATSEYSIKNDALFVSLLLNRSRKSSVITTLSTRTRCPWTDAAEPTKYDCSRSGFAEITRKRPASRTITRAERARKRASAALNPRYAFPNSKRSLCNRSTDLNWKGEA